MKEETKDKTELTDKEREFCELLVGGDSSFAGQADVCYREVFGDKKHISIVARKLMAKPHIASYIKELMVFKESEMENTAIKLQVAETLRTVMVETSKGEYLDKYGVALSPASLRAVSVNAAKALMDIYPIKHATAENGAGNNKGGGNVVFNVVVPQNRTNNGDKAEEQ